MRIRTIACSSSINLSWFLLILGWQVGVHWRCKLKFLLGCLCPLMAWRRVLCLLAIRQLSWWSRKELHWNLHESFISNGLGVSFVCSWSFTALRDTVGRPLINNVCHDVGASHHLGPYCRHVGWSFRRWWKQVYSVLYEVGCTLLLISLLAWVLQTLNARSLSTILEAHWFVRPLPMSECFYCRSFLWHLSHFSLFHNWSGGSAWVHKFIPNHE